MDTKECSLCNEHKPLEGFGWRNKAKGILRHDCKTCVSARKKEHYQQNKQAISARGKAKYQANKAPYLERARKRRETHPDEIKEQQKIYHLNNRERKSAYIKSYYQQNKAQIKEQQKGYRQENQHLRAASSRKRQVAKIQRTPSWANDQLIAAYYKEAKRLEELTGIQFHVDHIIPLQGELVSGLHVETNLQLLPAHENIGKSNSFDPETFCA